ncbi:MAG TPA: 2-dehydropantoate 2-reductase [Ensifer sp.]|nr:2-dehydropantoate 2-reductase [Ensifer sp.]
MKICIFGAGAVGGHMAVRLSKAGADVSAVCRGDILSAIRSDGLILASPDGAESSVRFPASDDPATFGRQDVVVFTVKYPALPAALAQAAPLLDADTRCIFAMNGLPWWFGENLEPSIDLALRDFIDPSRGFSTHVPSERWAHCAITSGNVITRPGRIVNTTPGLNRMAIGLSRPVRDTVLEDFARLATAGGYQAEIVDDIRERIWSKLLINAGMSAVSTLIDKNAHETCANPESRAVVMALMHELLDLGARIGVKIAADPAAMTDPVTVPPHITSFLQDLRAGRPLEIKTGILAVREIAKAVGFPAPVLSTTASLLCGRSPVAGM